MKHLIIVFPVPILIVFFNILLIDIVNSQSMLNLDSLENCLSILPDDTGKVNTLILLSHEYKKTNPEKALEVGNKALKLSIELKYPQGEIDALHINSLSYKDLGKFDSAFVLSNSAISICDSIGDEKRLAENYLLFGSILYRIEGPDEAKVFYRKSLGLFLKVNDSLGMADAYNSIASAFMMQSQFDSAIIYYYKVIKLSETIAYQNGLGKAFVNIGIAYSYLGEFEKAKSYLLQSIQTNENLNNKRYIGIAYSNIGNIAFDEHDYDLALEFYNKTIKIYVELKNQYGLANLYLNIGNIHIYKDEYSKAYEQYTKAKSIYQMLGDMDGYIAAYKNQGLVHERRKNYDQALIVYDSCLLLAKEIGSISRMMEISYNIFKTYELKQNHKKAFEYQSMYHLLKDSIFSIEKAETISELEVKYEKEKDQAQILALEYENLDKNLSLRKRTNQRNIYLFSGIGIIVIIIFSFVLYRQKTRKDKIIAEQKIIQLEEEKKLLSAKFLVEGQEEERKRIAKELHDGLGVLLSTTKMQFTSIKDKSPENREIIDKATKMLEQATGDVRKISHNMMPGLLTRFGLYEATEDLIENLNETEGIKASCEITGDTKRLPENKEIMLYRVIQEMVNNTLKHAESENIRLQIDVLPEKLEIAYSDDGKGFNVEEKMQLSSIGLNSIQSRVNFLSGEIKIKSSSGKGVNYNIHIPMV